MPKAAPSRKPSPSTAPAPAAAAPAKRRPVNAVIFDIDNVLIDTRRSYLDTIRWTVEIFLTTGRVPIFEKSGPAKTLSIVSPRDVEQFKLLGGFNDDWDCCYGLLIYLLSIPIRARTTATLKKTMDIEKFVASVYRRPLRVEGIVKKLGRPSFVTVEKIGRIFQEVYLGRDLFQKLYRSRPAYWPKRGLIEREKLLFRKSTLKKLKDRGIKLGVATGRPYFEAVYSLRRFGILELFEAMTTMDDVRSAEREQKTSLRKPHPFSVLETARKLGNERSFLYVGDLPDDVAATNAAKASLDIDSVAIPSLAFDLEDSMRQLKAVGPDHILNKPSDLIQLVARKRR
jgi:phosphoglycolate phosphatase-like HAD superfamily hydrolase